MPYAAKTPCRQGGCRALVSTPGFCELHRKVQQQQQDQERGKTAARGYGAAWTRASKRYRDKHPLCECDECKGNDPTQLSEVVDHIIPHKWLEAKQSGDPARIAKASALMWDRNNWQAMSKLHHDRKTGARDGGFGRVGRVESLRPLLP